MNVLHFSGEGRGFMSGIKEYVIITDDEEKDDEALVQEWIAPGFTLSSNTEIDYLPLSLPLNTSLVPER